MYDNSIYNSVLRYYTELVIEHNIEYSTDIIYPTEPFTNIIGQPVAVELLKLAIKNRRHVLLIGEPGTGKSLLAKTAAEVVPRYDFRILSLPNLAETSRPYIRHYTLDFDWPAYRAKHKFKPFTNLHVIAAIIVGNLVWRIAIWPALNINTPERPAPSLLLPCLSLIFSLASPFTNPLPTLNAIYWYLVGYDALAEAKCIYNSTDSKTPNFVDATGSHLEVIMGNVTHDPLTGLYSDDPTRDRSFTLLKPGCVHKAHNGILYIDEIGKLDKAIQYSLLTILQDKVAGIKGGRHSGAASSTESANKIPADFSLVMAGNLETVPKIHIALRSRIKGYGYEVFMNNSMQVTRLHTLDLLHFIAREIHLQGYLPCDSSALQLLLYHAVATSRVKGHYTLELRNFIGHIRAASDYAKQHNQTYFTRSDLETTILRYPMLERQIIRSINASALQKKNVKSGLPVVICTKLMEEVENAVESKDIHPMIVNVEFFVSKATSTNSIELHNLKLQTRNETIINRLTILHNYLRCQLAKYILPAQNQTIHVYFVHSQIHRFQIEESNFLFSIIGQYYEPTSTAVYIGEIDAEGTIRGGIRDLLLIEEALELDLNIVTSYDNADIIASFTPLKRKKIRFIHSITNLKVDVSGKWM